jgi:hypothetical protein
MKKARVVLYTVSILFVVLIACTTAVLASERNRPPADLAAVVSNGLELSFTVTEPEVIPTATPEPTATAEPTTAPESTATPEPTAVPAPAPTQGVVSSGDGSELLTIIVDNGDGTTISGAAIRRTRDAAGRITDQVTFDMQQAAASVAGAKAAGRTTARIVIPDPEDKVSELRLQIPTAALNVLFKGGLDLEIYSDNAAIKIPNASLSGIMEDLYFRLVPIKDATQRAEVEERARVERVVREAVYGEDVQVVARPMTIETNLTSRAVEITLPLKGVLLPEDEKERTAFLAKLAVFIEHSDGDRELIRPEFVQYKQGLSGLSFGINKFSTFTILKLEGSGAVTRHDAYILGYPDGTFRPDRGITRGELAAILYRLKAEGTAPGSATPAALTDITGKRWSDPAVQYTVSTGLMNGYPDATFRSEAFVSRAELAAIVSRWLGLPAGAGSTFADTAKHWAHAEIGALLQEKLIAGYPDGTFRPAQSLTRAEAVTIINTILQRNSESWSQSSWSDVPTAHWAFQAIQEASVAHDYAGKQ